MNANDRMESLLSHLVEADVETARYPRRARRLAKLMVQVKAERPELEDEDLARATRERYGSSLLALFALNLLVSVCARIICYWLRKHLVRDQEVAAMAGFAAASLSAGADAADEDE